MRILSNELAKHVGKKVELAGWLHKKRLLGGITFVLLRDRGGLSQIKIEDKKQIEKLRNMQTGTVLEVSGTVAKDERAPDGIEVHNPDITVISAVSDTPPIEIDKPIDHKSENLDTLFEHRVLSLRNQKEQAIFKIQAKVLEALREYLYQNDFVEFNSPKLLAGSTEGGAEVFKLDHFGKVATLAQSAQFYKQIMVGVFERAFEINPTYRAEPSATTRHMTEFIHIDVEMGFINFKELLAFTSGLLNFVIDKVWAESEAELKLWDAIKPKLTPSLPAISLTEVHELYSAQGDHKTVDEPDLRPDEERFASDYSAKKYDSEAIFVVDWPRNGAKFYHRFKDGDPDVAERADLLFRGVEIATASMREHNYGKLVKQLKDMTGADPDNPGFKYYLDAFKYGMPPHGGFGMGLERLTQKIIGLNNVKEASLFPRDLNRLAP